MSIHTYTETETNAESRDDTASYVSPFSGLVQLAEARDEEADAKSTAATGYATGESPFDAFYAAESPFQAEEFDESAAAETALAEFLESLHDEEFTETLDQLLNEGAAKVLADEQQWQSPPTPTETQESLQEWTAPLATEWEKAMDGYAAGLENADPIGMSEEQFEQLLESLETRAAFATEGFENFFGTLIRKARNTVRSAVRFAKNPVKGVLDIAEQGWNVVEGGVTAIGKHLIGPLLKKLKRAGLALLKGVVKKLVRPLTKLLPVSVRPLIPILVQRLGAGEAAETSWEFIEDETSWEFPVGETGPAANEFEGEPVPGAAEELTEAFDTRLAALLVAPESEADSRDEIAARDESPAGDESAAFEFAYESDGGESEDDPIGELDDARARLAYQLADYTGTEAPIAQIRQFVPAVLAIRPLLKLGLTLTGARSKLIDLIADPLANLIKNMVGADAMATITQAVGQEPSRMIARAAVGLGFNALGLEAPQDHRQIVAGEALASAVEATVLRVADELTESAVADPLQVSAAVQRAFAEAAAAYLPDRLLRTDLPERETSDEGGFWVMMPRAVRPRYRFRRYTRVFPVTIPRQIARAMTWSDGGTLESYLLDRGVEKWPVHTEVDLYETMPGTLAGHLTRDETLPAQENPNAEDFQPLTAQAATLLLRQPALGRNRGRPVTRPQVFRPQPGQRYFRIRTAGLPARRTRRPRRVITIRWDPVGSRLRVVIRLSERRARELERLLRRTSPSGQRNLPAALIALWDIVLPRLRLRLARRLLTARVVGTPAAAARLAGALTAATGTGIGTFLTQRGAQLTAAAGDRAEGVTIIVTFTGLARDATRTPTPVVTVIPGWRHD
ncbi:hypothetical protein [Nocardia sp. BMG111209]|uniref:hypothetical protein n=1 Tax=Nocardia sp. BMG111209 TaxID=1160137 RepID=UPI00039E3AA8|nr:hypothetical protein [Nocardia sp. BMG111209]